MLDKICVWVDNHGGSKLLRKIGAAIAIVCPAIIGYSIYETGRSQGQLEQYETDEKLIKLTADIADKSLSALEEMHK